MCIRDRLTRLGLSYSVINTKSMAFKGCFPVRCKLVLIDQLIEQVHLFRFLGCDLSYVGEIDAVSYTHLDVYKRQAYPAYS